MNLVNNVLRLCVLLRGKEIASRDAVVLRQSAETHRFGGHVHADREGLGGEQHFDVPGREEHFDHFLQERQQSRVVNADALTEQRQQRLDLSETAVFCTQILNAALVEVSNVLGFVRRQQIHFFLGEFLCVLRAGSATHREHNALRSEMGGRSTGMSLFFFRILMTSRSSF